MLSSKLNKIIISEKSTPHQIILNAVSYPQEKILGTLKAEIANKKLYSKVKFPSFYTNDNGQFFTATKPHIYVSDLFVNSDVRKQGIGKKLIYALVKISDKIGFDGRVILNAFSKEASPLGFYKKLGFVTPNASLNNKIDLAIKNGTQITQNEQVYMSLPQKKILKILKQS